MRHKHGLRGGNPNAATSVRDAYGFEVCAHTCCTDWASRGHTSAHAHSSSSCARLHRSRRICSVYTINMHQYGKRKKWSVLKDGMHFWLTLRPCTKRPSQTSRTSVFACKPFCIFLPRCMFARCLSREERGGPLQQLEQACQGWAPEDRGASKELNDWQHQLRSLVQAGIPMVID